MQIIYQRQMHIHISLSSSFQTLITTRFETTQQIFLEIPDYSTVINVEACSGDFRGTVNFYRYILYQNI